MARSIEEIQRNLGYIQQQINNREELYNNYKDLNIGLTKLKADLNNLIKSKFNGAFEQIKKGYVDDNGNYIGFSLMDDIIGDGGTINNQINAVSTLIEDSAKSMKRISSELSSYRIQLEQDNNELDLKIKSEK